MAVIEELSPDEIEAIEKQNKKNSSNGNSDDVPLDEQDDLTVATRLKDAANARFKEGDTTKALEMYEQAKALLEANLAFDKSQGQEEAQNISGTFAASKSGFSKETNKKSSLDNDENDNENENETEEPKENTYTREEIEKLPKKVVDLIGILWANIAACYAKLEQWDDCVHAADEALLWKPNYVKALQRRITANEKINSWASLSAAIGDLDLLLSLPDIDQSTKSKARLDKRRLEPKMQEQQKKETDEVLGKLKDLGNTFLGKFGMSTDNFKFTPNGNGGYSMNFQQ